MPTRDDETALPGGANAPDEARLLDVALTAARAAADVHRASAGDVRVEEWNTKGSADFVTRVDHEAERAALDVIRAAFPDHRIMAEEGSPDTDAAHADSGWTWIVDPLDGTTNFLHGYPMYSASVAVAFGGRPIAGVVIGSATDEEWTARRGAGAFRNGEPIRVSGIERLEHALVGTGFPFKTLERMPEFLRQLDAVLRSTSGVRRAGSAALDLCHVASGYFDGFWELYLSPWDVAAGALIAREAGGVVTRMDGSDDVLRGGAYRAGNPTIHEKLGQLLKNV